jgi:tRNA nucleotidyltransferase (CCA-adding enzyme)
MSNADVRRTVFAHGLKRSLRIVRLAYRFGRLSRREEQLWRRRFRHADWEMPLDDPSQLALDGRALMQISGREPGPWIGRVLDTLLDKVVSGEVINHPSRLEKEWRLHGPHAP